MSIRMRWPIIGLARLCVFFFLYSISGTYLLADRSLKGRANNPPPCHKRFYNQSSQMTTDYRQCLLSNLSEETDIFNHLHLAVGACVTESFRRLLDAKLLSNTAETKVAVLPYPIDQEKSCIEVTLGVGGNILAEQELRNLMPHCTFYGADPILAYGRVFEKWGSIFSLRLAEVSLGRIARVS